jgi:hypothetical protein
MAKTEFVGLPELGLAFRSLATNADRTARKMVVAAGRILKNEAKRIATSFGLKQTGALLKNIAIKREKTEAGVAQYHLGVRHGRNLTKKAKSNSALKVKGSRIVSAAVDDPYYWRFHELGWTPRGAQGALRGSDRNKARQRSELKAKGKFRSGTPFIGPALENKGREAIDAMGIALAEELSKESKT